jgi:hypothetical protein
MPIYKLNKKNFQHTQEILTSIIGVVFFGKELVQNVVYHTTRFLCICQGVVTSPRTWRGTIMMHHVVMQPMSSHLRKNPRDDNEPGDS